MDFADVVRQRRVERSYTPEPVDDAALRRIVSVVNRAPSAGFSQGYRVVVVTDQKLRQEAADIAEARYVELGFPRWIASAPVHIYVATREATYRERYAGAPLREGWSHIPWPVPFWWFDAGALFMLLKMAAINEGLGTGVFSSVFTDELDQIAGVVGLPEDTKLTGVITIGHVDHSVKLPVPPGAATRKPLEEIVEWRL